MKPKVSSVSEKEVIIKRDSFEVTLEESSDGNAKIIGLTDYSGNGFIPPGTRKLLLKQAKAIFRDRRIRAAQLKLPLGT